MPFDSAQRLYCGLLVCVTIHILGWLTCVSSVQAAQTSYEEYEVKAAFLFNFAKYVEWPEKAFADERDPIIVGVLGENPFKGRLEQIAKGKTIGERELVIRIFKRVQDIKKCHILFIGASERNNMTEILKTLEEGHILAVGETKEFALQGGIIGFTKEENKIRFEINADAAERAGLKISSKLLKLARIVKNGKGRKENR
ncbi:YfiR family protein [Candidatus Hydrogenedentota bacterium]